MRVFGRDDDKDDDLIMFWPQMMGHQQAQMGGCSITTSTKGKGGNIDC